MGERGVGAVLSGGQLARERCGHTPGKGVVGREEAYDRIRAAVDAREAGADILILARTDARHDHGLAEALARAQKFRELGADILFVEAPRSEAEMREVCAATDAPNMANIVEGGDTPDLPREVLQDIGYRIAAYPLTLMASAMQAMVGSLQQLAADQPREGLMEFGELRRRIGFDDYYEASQGYVSSARSVTDAQ